jgi:pimeloyl-ACP methyl ester carboxylesterase
MAQLKRAILNLAMILLLMSVMSGFVSSASRAQSTQQVPLVFIPGILGSKLCDGDNVVWGGLGSLRRFSQLDTFTDRGQRLKPCGILDRIQILGPFWANDGYNKIVAFLSTLGYQETSNLLLYDYDWRQSNFETAERLRRLLDEREPFRSEKFDIFAHSMGGLVAKVLLQDPNLAKRVRRVIYLGTPFQGSSNALATLAEGWGPFANLIAGGLDTIRTTALSFVSIYELMPRYAECCRIGAPENPLSIVKLPTILDAELWRRHDWLPEEYRTGTRAAFFTASIQSAERMRDASSQAHLGVEEVRIAGTGIDTRLHLYIDSRDTSWRRWRFIHTTGDGTVPLWSASGGNLADASPAFSPHASIFEDRWVVERLRWLFVNPFPPPMAGPGVGVRTIRGEDKAIARVIVSASPELGQPGSRATLSVRVLTLDPIAPGELVPSFRLGGGEPLTLEETTSSADQVSRALTFSKSFLLPSEIGVHRLDVEFGPTSRASTYIMVEP